MFKFDKSIIAKNDPLRKLADQWALYCEGKYNTVRQFKKISTIAEIGVRCGYGAWAMLCAHPKAIYYGFDANNGQDGGAGGPWSPYAEQMLTSYGFKVVINHKFDSQKCDSRLPVCADLYHVDALHTAEAAYHDIDICFNAAKSGAYILVDDYSTDLGKTVKEGADQWVEEHKEKITSKVLVNTYHGDLLIHKK